MIPKLTRSIQWGGFLIILLVVLLLAARFGPNKNSTPAGTNSVPLAEGAVPGPLALYVYPQPGAQLTTDEYNKGIPIPVQGKMSDFTCNLVIHTDILFGRQHVCSLFDNSLSPSTPCITFQTPTDTDFFSNVEIWVDNQQVNGGKLGSENTNEVQDSSIQGGYYLCYRLQLNSGSHKMRYIFQWLQGNILDTGEWPFSIVNPSKTP